MTPAAFGEGSGTGQLRYAETEFGRSMDASSGGISVPLEADEQALTLQLRFRLEPRGYRFANYLIDAASADGASVWRVFTPAKGGLVLERAASQDRRPLRVEVERRVVDGQWHRLAVVLEPARSRIVLDGEILVDRKHPPHRPQRPHADIARLWVGQALDGHRGCDGWLDDIMISRGVRDLGDVWQQDGHTLAFLDFEESQAEYLAQWTPLRSTRSDAEPWEQENDDDWVDERFQQMDKGQAFACSTRLPGRTVGQKTLSIALGEERPSTARGPMLMFDTQRCAMVAGLQEAWIRISPRRFGILEMPELVGDEVFHVDAARAWSRGGGTGAGADPAGADPAAADRPHVRYRGFYRHGRQTVLSYELSGADVLESAQVAQAGPLTAIVRRMSIGRERELPGPVELTLLDEPAAVPLALSGASGDAQPQLAVRVGEEVVGFRLINATGSAGASAAVLKRDGPQVRLALPRGASQVDVLVCRGTQAEVGAALGAAASGKLNAEGKPLRQMISGGPPQWSEEGPIATPGTRGDDTSAYVIDTIPPPFENPFQALMFLTGIDFFASGETAAVCTVHGDVWLVEGLDEDLRDVCWQRFAAGLYQPLGLRIVEDTVHVLGRDQITRLHDLNGDGEADFYENFNNDLHVTGTPHAYATCLETDPAGYFYFFKCGKAPPHGGKLLRLSPDGERLDVFAGGYRHPVGLGVSPEGLVTAADNQGNWVPSSAIQVVQEGTFHGYMPELHQPEAPDRFEPPLCWIPISEDNASGGQVWAPDAGRFGPLGGGMLHLSWGRCTLHHVLMEQVEGRWQGGVVRVPGIRFAAGPIMGRFNPRDGQLYVVGLDGWQTAATQDGCLQRVRYTGKPLCLPTELHAHENGLQIRFTAPLDAAAAAEPGNWRIEQWQYRWSAAYGSPEFSISEPNRVGRDPVPVERIDVRDGGRTVFLHIPDLAPVMQMAIHTDVTTARGRKAPCSIYNTIHHLAPPGPTRRSGQ